MTSTDNPIVLDIKDLEHAIIMLEKTMKDLTAMMETEEMDEETRSDMRVVIVENEFAISTKLRKRADLRAHLGLEIEDDFAKERSLIYNNPDQADFAHNKVPVLLETGNTSGKEEGIAL